MSTLKLQLNYRKTWKTTWKKQLNKTSITKDINKKPPQMGRSGRYVNWAGPIPMYDGWELGRISVTGVPYEIRGPSSIWVSPTWSTSARKKSHHNNWLWKSVGILSVWVRQKAAGNPGVFLKGSYMDSLALAKRLHLKMYQRHIRKNWIMGFRARAAIVLLSSPPTKQPAGKGRCQIWICINLLNTIHPTPVTQSHTTLSLHLALSETTPHKQPCWWWNLS